MINPALNFGPRLLDFLIGTGGVFDGVYWAVAPIIGPFIGGVADILTYDWFVTPFLSDAEETVVDQAEIVTTPT